MNVVIKIFVLLGSIIYALLEAFVKLFIPERPKSVLGKVTVVTGAGRGIGREIALGLARVGAKVAVWDIDEESSIETANLIKEFGGVSAAYKCDVTKTKDIADVAAKVRRDLGEVDILVNNAGVLSCKTILELEERDIRRTMEVNAISQFWTVKEFLPHMVTKNSGHIIIVASMAAKIGTPLLTDYCSTKFAADGFGQSLNAELARMNKTGIKITIVYPMFVRTNLVTDLFNRVDLHSGFNPMLDPQQVASDIIYGALRDHFFVFIPGFMRTIKYLALLPQRAQKAAMEFMDVGFYEK